MATEPDPTAGTGAPPAPGTEGAPAGDGAPGSDEGEKKVTITSHEYVTLKASREQAKADAAELAKHRAEAAARTTTTDTRTPPADVFEMTEAEAEQYEKELNASFVAGNRDAGALLMGVKRAKEAKTASREVLDRLDLSKIPDDQHEAVKKYRRETGAPTLAIAWQLMRGGTTFETLAQENARLTKELADAKKGRPVIERTRIVGSPAGVGDDDGTPEKTLDEYHEAMRKNPHQTIADRKAGKFRIKVS